LNHSLYIAKRYLFSKSSNSAVNIISKIAVAAVILGSLSLFIVLSGFSGLKDFALEYTNVFDSDLRVIPSQGKHFSISKIKLEQLGNISGVKGVSGIVEDRVFIRYEDKNMVVFLKGTDANYKKITPIDSILYFGEWYSNMEGEVVMGFGISSKLNIPPRDYGNPIEFYAPKPGTGAINKLDPTSAFKSEKVVASGVYEINEELNSKYIFSDISLARSLFSLDSTQYSSLEFRIEKGANEENIKNEIHTLLENEIIIKNRIQQNDALYKMLNSENLFTYLFVSLIAGIAIFNLAGTIIMIILDKRNNIKTLYFLGLTVKEIRRIFFFNGFLMTLIGLIIGLILGAVIVGLQIQYGWVPITPTLPYPVKLKLLNIIIVFVTILILGGIASKIASMRVTEKLLS